MERGMKMSKKMTWSLGFVLAIILVLAGVSPVSADSSTPGDGYTAPAPTKVDASGSDQDGYIIPADFFEHPQYDVGMYRVDGKAMAKGFHKLKTGATSVTITTDFNSGTWTFDFTSDNLGEEAENKYAVKVGDTCKRAEDGTRYREVTAYFTNVADETGRYVHSIYPRTSNARDEYAHDVDIAFNILDGETAAMRIGIFDDLPGLTPGEWKVVFWRSDEGSAALLKGEIVKRKKITVPKCGKGSDPTTVSKKPRGELKRVGCEAARAVADVRGYTATPKVTYKVVKKLKGHKAKKRSFAAEAGKKSSLVVRKSRRSVVVMVLKVKRSDGGWTKLDRLRVPRCR